MSMAGNKASSPTAHIVALVDRRPADEITTRFSTAPDAPVSPPSAGESTTISRTSPSAKAFTTGRDVGGLRTPLPPTSGPTKPPPAALLPASG